MAHLFKLPQLARNTNFTLIDLLLAIVLLLPPLIYLDSVSRHFNVKVAALELVFIVSYFCCHGFKLKLVKSKYLLLFLVFALWITITIPFAEDQKYAFNRNLCVLIHILFGFAIWRYLKSDQYKGIYLCYLISLSFFLPAIGTIIYWLSSGITASALAADLPFYSNIRHLGYHATAALIFSIFLLLNVKGSYTRFFLNLWLVTVAIFLLWSGGRGPLVSLLITGCLLLLLTPSFRVHILTTMIIISIITGLLIFFKVDVFGYGIINRTLSTDSWDGLFSGRITLWNNALQSIDNWLVGIGGDNFKQLEFVQRQNLAQAHNVAIQAVLDWGVIGASLFFAILFSIIRTVSTLISQLSLTNKSVIVPIGFLFTFLFLSLVDGVFYHGIPFMLFSAGTAFIVSIYNLEKITLY